MKKSAKSAESARVFFHAKDD